MVQNNVSIQYGDFKQDTKEPYEWEELEVLSYDELVDLLVGSKKMYVVEL